jgi:glycosyltransferase involved in cell wall biosynthesis
VPTLISALTRRAVKVGGAFDLIHAHWMFPAGLAGKAAARTHGIPLVVTSHGGDLNMSRHAWPLRALVRRISSAASACVGVSHAMVEEFVRQGIPPEKVCFIPLGVPSFKGSVTDPSALPRFFDKGIGLRIVYVGSLIPRKSVHTLLKAHGILERRGRVPGTLVIGSGPSESALRGLTATLGLTNVIFCGAQPPHVTTSWLRAADVLVLPSLSEGRGLVLLEAMEAGLPVIASDIPGPRELVIPNETGMLFPPGDAEALARCLERLFDDGALGSLLGAAGKELLQRERLTPDESARQHIALYESLGSGS